MVIARRFISLVLLIAANYSSAQVLERDSLALVDFFDKTNGEAWFDNRGWLKAPAGFWKGVQLDPGGQVIGLRLPNNNLTGRIPETIRDMVSLHLLELSHNQLEQVSDAVTEMEILILALDHNQLTALPDFSHLLNSISLYVNNNKLDFGDLEPNAPLSVFFYDGQDSIGEATSTILTIGDSAVLSCNTSGSFNSYQWFRNGVLQEQQTHPQIAIESTAFEDLGTYHCQISNDLLSDLVISSRPQELQAFTTINGAIIDNNGQFIPAELEFYRENGLGVSLKSLLQTDNGVIDNQQQLMGNFIIKIRPLSGNAAPIYLGQPTIHWNVAEFQQLDGNHPTFNMQLVDVVPLNGELKIAGKLTAGTFDYSRADIYLFELTGGNPVLRGHTQADPSGDFSFGSLPPGKYTIQIDIPGISNPENNFEATLETEDIDLVITFDQSGGQVIPQHSVAREWNEVLLEAIRNDFARPTVHARNLFHTSAAMYDAWAVFDEHADTYLIGNLVHEFGCALANIVKPDDEQALQEAKEEAISYAAFRLLRARFDQSPGTETALRNFEEIMINKGYDPAASSIDYTAGDAAALGNYIAQCYIDYGLQDGSNEANEYTNRGYESINQALVPAFPGNPNLTDPNRWQPLTLDIFIDQADNVIPRNTPEFLSPEWGLVSPFSLRTEDLQIYQRDGFEYWVYQDPGAPPYINLNGDSKWEKEYKWGFAMVSIWSAHLDPADGVMWDISPAAIGNNPDFPASFEDYDGFFNFIEGGDQSRGYSLNPKTGQPYEPQIVPRADYGRVLAEFWADGPDSETPPGHWFTILNYVNDHPLIKKRFRGAGAIVDDLEWDVKAYFVLGGAMHDVAVSAWGIKGWYDYIRPISAIRSMADRGQSSDPSLSNYHEDGIPLVPGYIEVIEADDPMAGNSGEHVSKIKLLAWRGPDFIANPDTFIAGVDWILAENWWPYQRPSFVTPPFAGYISGHSTFSRAAAEVLTLLTGDEYFPGGIGEFQAKKDEFLVFEDGPSVDITLQWATYRDASDQTSLSRIWGGIHPPADDIPGRIIGEKIGIQAFELAEKYFQGTAEIGEIPEQVENVMVSFFPNPLVNNSPLHISIQKPFQQITFSLFNLQGKGMINSKKAIWRANRSLELDLTGVPNGLYLLAVSGDDWKVIQKIAIAR